MVLGAPTRLKYKISSLMIRHFPGSSLPDPHRTLPPRITLALRIYWIKHDWRYLIPRPSMHTFSSTSFICTSTSYTFGLCLVHVTQESPTIEDSLGLPILDEVECGPDIFLSHAELLITPSLPQLQPASRMCMPLTPLSLFCKPVLGPLLCSIFSQVASLKLYICYPSSP
jgi:hypothetical protein